MLRIEPSTSRERGKRSTTELAPQPQPSVLNQCPSRPVYIYMDESYMSVDPAKLTNVDFNETHVCSFNKW